MLYEAFLVPVPGAKRFCVMVTDSASRSQVPQSVYVLLYDDGHLEVVSRRLKARLIDPLLRSADGGWYRTREELEKASLALHPPVEVRSVPLSRATFEILDRLWNAALSDAAVPRLATTNEIVVVEDNIHYHFGNSAFGADFMDGQTGGPEGGPRMDALIQVAEKLAAVARAEAKDRPALEKSLREDAQALLKRF